MTICRICLHQYKKLRFKGKRISICGRCVNTLNDTPEVAKYSEKRLAKLLAQGMYNNAFRDINSPKIWEKKKAEWTLNHFDLEHKRALPRWLNKLLSNPKNSTRDFKNMRAFREGFYTTIDQ